MNEGQTEWKRINRRAHRVNRMSIPDESSVKKALEMNVDQLNGVSCT